MEYGALVDTADNRGCTALMVAAQTGRAEAVGRLLRAGAEPRARDRNNQTAADLAANDGIKSLILNAM